jgi:hypothetical protein
MYFTSGGVTFRDASDEEETGILKTSAESHEIVQWLQRYGSGEMHVAVTLRCRTERANIDYARYLETERPELITQFNSRLKNECGNQPGPIVEIQTTANIVVAQHSVLVANGDDDEHANFLKATESYSDEQIRTAVERLVQQRRGQARLRRQVLDDWNGQCAITGLNVESLLIASHIKPWRHSTSAERLDRFNVLPLAPHLDALFDAGFITISEHGEVLISSHLSTNARNVLGLERPLRVSRQLTPAHQVYLAYHREVEFKAGPAVEVMLLTKPTHAESDMDALGFAASGTDRAIVLPRLQGVDLNELLLALQSEGQL